MPQTEYYVQSVKAKVMSGPSFKSGVIAEVAKGYKLACIGQGRLLGKGQDL